MLLLSSCTGGGAHSGASTRAAGQSASPASSPSVNGGYARAAAILQEEDDHLQSVLTDGQKLGSDLLRLAIWDKSAMDWEQSHGDVYSKAERVLQDSLAPSTSIDTWNMDYLAADVAVLHYMNDRSSGASGNTLDRDITQAKSALDQADAAAKMVASGH
jgi:hypothetical protein